MLIILFCGLRRVSLKQQMHNSVFQEKNCSGLFCAYHSCRERQVSFHMNCLAGNMVLEGSATRVQGLPGPAIQVSTSAAESRQSIRWFGAKLPQKAAEH